MNTEPKFQLRLSHEKELELRTTIVSGLLASGQFTYPPEDFGSAGPGDPLNVLLPYSVVTPGPDDTEIVTGRMLVSAVANEILCQLRRDVEKHASENPESYASLADQLPTS